MKKHEYETIDKMLKSTDKESRYLAYTILRNDTTKKSKQILNRVSLFERIENYQDVCTELGITELSINDFSFLPEKHRRKALAQHKIQNLERLFNKRWSIDWKDNNQYKYYPYYTINGSGGLVFCRSGYFHGDSFCGVVGFYKNEVTSDFVGKVFIDIYQDML